MNDDEIKVGDRVHFWRGAQGVGDGDYGEAISDTIRKGEHGNHFGVDHVWVRHDTGGSDAIALTHIERVETECSSVIDYAGARRNCSMAVGHKSAHRRLGLWWTDEGQTDTDERIHAREYPDGVPTSLVDAGCSAVFREFPGDTWRNASGREVVGVVLSAVRSQFALTEAVVGVLRKHLQGDEDGESVLNDPQNLRAVGGEPVDAEMKDGKPARRARRQPKRGGYSGGRPADEVGPPDQTPSGSPPPSAYKSLGVWRTPEDDARLDAALAAVTRGEQAAFSLIRSRMILCPECGNKRCPHATDEANPCTGSNEPGQPGSAYGERP